MHTNACMQQRLLVLTCCCRGTCGLRCGRAAGCIWCRVLHCWHVVDSTLCEGLQQQRHTCGMHWCATAAGLSTECVSCWKGVRCATDASRLGGVKWQAWAGGQHQSGSATDQVPPEVAARAAACAATAASQQALDMQEACAMLPFMIESSHVRVQRLKGMH